MSPVKVLSLSAVSRLPRDRDTTKEKHENYGVSGVPVRGGTREAHP
jgi:hypothetical protein